MSYEITTLSIAQIQQRIQDNLTLAIRTLEAKEAGQLTYLTKKIQLIDRATNKLLGLGLNKREARKIVDQAKLNGDKPAWKVKQ